ncbi:hypothetical protein NA57DRAFT_80948 [Rhizodiscina lignyota]|uniref:Uncharacterized protein n=1 Tax=Rhizodiscina lignyota TaxID=1504668 RepID=A0A9P4M1T8_9PEZI|nr:hypothetical protein NA57DRAFT_80948 [Rhizodiscina lignyota]
MPPRPVGSALGRTKSLSDLQELNLSDSPPPSPPPPPSSLEADRQKSRDDWIKRGTELNDAMGLKSIRATEIYLSMLGGPRMHSRSPFTQYSEQDANGWIVKKYRVLEQEDLDDLTSMFAHIGASNKMADNVPVSWIHTGKTEAYPDQGTGATYSNAFNAKGGLILSLDNENPEYHGRKRGEPYRSAEVPGLRHWSDAVFLEWSKQAGDAAKNLKWVFVKDVIEESTRALMVEILFELGLQLLPLFKDVEEIDPQSEHGEMLVGSPTGRGIAWLLIQHKAELGRKKIAGIRFFRDDGAPEGVVARGYEGRIQPKAFFNMLFRLEDIE